MKRAYLNKGAVIKDYLFPARNHSFAETILTGLSQHQKYIDSMFLYDNLGSKLYEEITRLPEYYPCRTENKILRQAAERLTRDMKGMDIVEIGGGDCSKISILLEACPPAGRNSLRYIPVDISRSAIEQSAHSLAGSFPEIEFHGLVADFMNPMHFIPAAKAG